MAVNGKRIDVSPNGRGHVEFTIPVNAAKDKPVKAYWEGTIRVGFNDRDSTLRVRVPYTIRPRQR